MAEARQKAISKVTIIGALLDGFLALAKIMGGLLFQSTALVADGIHSASDIITDGFVLVVNRAASAKPDTEHPYGHARFETIASAALGAVLIVVATGIAWEVTNQFFHQSESQLNALALIIAAISIFSKEWIFHYTMHVAKATGSSLLAANAWHSRSDALSSLVVFIGLAGALMGATWLEPVAAVIVALMIGRMGLSLIIEALNELVDKGLSQSEYDDIRRAALSITGIENIHQPRSRWHAGKVLLDIHVQVDSDLSVSEGHRLGDEVAKAIRALDDKISDITVHIDPEDDSVEHSSYALPMRDHIEQTLKQFGELENWQKLLLHYRAGRIDIELFYLANRRDSGLEGILQKATAELPEVNSAAIWYEG